VSWAVDAELGRAPVGEKIVVVGAGAVGLEAAIDFKQAGKDVTVIELADPQAAAMRLMQSAGTASREFGNIIAAENIPVHYEVRLLEVKDDKVICEDASGKTAEFAADTVLLAIGMTPLRDVADSLRRCAPETEVHIVGDCKEPASIYEAVNTAFQVALHI
jgi:NADPH-dependent 2,4-dienoyl-CoA reductase/sulfur reductase-like enzyme